MGLRHELKVYRTYCTFGELANMVNDFGLVQSCEVSMVQMRQQAQQQ